MTLNKGEEIWEILILLILNTTVLKNDAMYSRKKWPLINVIPFLRKYGAGVSTSWINKLLCICEKSILLPKKVNP